MATKKRQQWEEHDMEQALNSVQRKIMGFKSAAKTFSVPKTTLMRRFKKQQGSSKGDLGGPRTTFPKQVEIEICEHIIEMETRFFGLTSKDLRRLVYELAERNGLKHFFNHETRMAGWKWVKGFLNRNPRISLRTPENTSLARAAFNRPNICAYFLALSKILDKYNFSPENMYNMDESGLTTVQKKSQKIYAAKGRKQVGAPSSAERGQHVTIVCAMNAIGTYVPPALIFPRKRLSEELMSGSPIGSICFAQEKGWMTTEIFKGWLQHFLRYTKASKENPVLLLLDGHGSHKGLEGLSFAKENGIIIFCFPAHCSHHVQPLDVGFFKPLHTYYDREIELWLRQNPGKVMTQFKIANLFNKAYLKSAVPSNAINSFKKTGIHPFNPDVFEDWQFSPSLTTDQQIEPEGTVIPQVKPQETDTDKQSECASECEPGPSGINDSASDLNVSVRDILPPPVASADLEGQRKTRKRGNTGWLNSTPEMEALKAKSAEKVAKIRKQEGRKAKRKVHYTNVTNEEDTIEAFEDDGSEDVACIYCNELFSHSKAREKWIRCQKCSSWCHNECAGVAYKCKMFVCELCK